MKFYEKTNYETHRPKELAQAGYEEQVVSVLNPEARTAFFDSRNRAGTAGPIMVNNHMAMIPGSRIRELFDKALIEGATPCYVDDETGQVFMGEFVFVPQSTEEAP